MITRVILFAASLLALLFIAFKGAYRASLTLAQPKRRTLFILSAAAAFALTFPILNLSFSYLAKETPRKRVFLYIDNSFSMRSAVEKDTFFAKIAEWKQTAPYRVETFFFDRVAMRADAPTFSGSQTRFNAAFAHYANAKRETDNARMVIVTDMKGTLSRIPDETAYIVSVANNETPNIAITRAEGTPSLRVGERITITYGITAEHLKELTSAEITVTLDNRLIARNTLSLSNGVTLFSVSYTPEREGEALLSARLSRIEHEATEDDNARHDILRVEKRSIDLLLVSGAPAKDFGILKNAIQNDRAINLRESALSELKTSIPSSLLKSAYDAVIVLNPNETLFAAAGDFFSRLTREGVPLLVLYATDGKEDPKHPALFPKVQRENAPIRLTVVDANAPYIRLSRSEEETRALWESITFFDTLFVPANFSGTPLIRANGKPAVTRSTVGKSLVIHVFMAPLYELKLYGTVFDLDGYYDTFIAAALTSMKASGKGGDVVITPETARVGERVTILSETPLTLFYTDSAPSITNAAVKGNDMTLTKTNALRVPKTITTLVTPEEPGVIRVGDYRKTAINPPYEETLSDDAPLRAYAESRGTIYEGLDAAFWNEVTFEDAIIETQKRVSLWRNPLYFGILTVLILTLWSLKRRYALS